MTLFKSISLMTRQDKLNKDIVEVGAFANLEPQKLGVTESQHNLNYFALKLNNSKMCNINSTSNNNFLLTDRGGGVNLARIYT